MQVGARSYLLALSIVLPTGWGPASVPVMGRNCTCLATQSVAGFPAEVCDWRVTTVSCRFPDWI